MSLTWPRRKARLRALLQSQGDEDNDALALDRLLHGHSVIGKTTKTTELDVIRFQDTDLTVVGTLEYGQFGIDVVNCGLDGRVYVRKSTEKIFASRARDQCSPQVERDILLQALKTDSPWVPHLFCAYQTPTHLNLVMEYAEGGNLWDLLESSPLDGRISEQDLGWWTPQIVSAIHWCHSQGFVHRDIKPHNFVLTPNAHILLIDFGSAAPLLPPESDGARLLAKKYCVVPCGTCDYISPEILKAHERALVALEFDGDSQAAPFTDERDVYGLETDWWSLGSMLYEMAYGFAPFFAEDIKKTYVKIMEHTRYLRFNANISISPEFQDFLQQLLKDAEFRLGRRNIYEITEHPVFADVEWDTLATQSAPSVLHLPQFIYSESATKALPANDSHAFAFSALFQSSPMSGIHIPASPSTPGSGSVSDSKISSTLIGFSWGPILEIEPDSSSQTPRPSIRVISTPQAAPLFTPVHPGLALPGAGFHARPFTTPDRPNHLTPFATLPRSTVRRTVTRRSVSDREAFKQLVDCVGMSARKKVLESGRKPRVLLSFKDSRSSLRTVKKELRFLPSPITLSRFQVPVVDTSESEDTDSEVPLSPSPSPRPGSAMSMSMRPGSALSMMRSGTPTITGTFSQRTLSTSGLLSRDNVRRGRRESFRDENTGSNIGVEASQVFSPTFEDSTFDDLEEKYGSLMDEIQYIQDKLNRLAGR
ncbi:kinase-like domain-containing protein [Mycena floridula]|nr:kinase-like domain-containing protein [Mycena floridula]